jgi:DNA polymerase-3 subunit gamma/tau
VQLFYQIALQGRRDLPLSPDPRSGFEMLLLRMMSFRPLREGMQLSAPLDQAKKKTIEPEQKPPETQQQTAVTVPDKSVQQPLQSVKQTEEAPPWEVLPDELDTSKPIIDQAINEVVAKQQTTQEPSLARSESHVSVNSVKNDFPEKPKSFIQTNKWHEVIPQLSLNGRSAELIKHSHFERKENGIISLIVDKANQGLLGETVQLEVEAALSEFYGEKLGLKLIINEIEQVGTGPKDDKETPSRRTEREKIELQRQAEQNIETDPFVIELKNRFGAQVVPGSVFPK